MAQMRSYDALTIVPSAEYGVSINRGRMAEYVERQSLLSEPNRVPLVRFAILLIGRVLLNLRNWRRRVDSQQRKASNF